MRVISFLKISCLAKQFVALTSALFLIGCASAPPLSTSSGRPEITTAATSQSIKRELERQFASINVFLISSQENVFVFEGDADKLTTLLETNSTTGAKPRVRYRANVIDIGASRRVYLQKSSVKPATRQNPAAEREITLSTEMQEMQALLQRLKLALDGKQ